MALYTTLFKTDISLILIQRLWQSFAGLITMVLIAHFLTPIQQGWYYSFLSLAALYTLFDLGLSVVLVQLSAHLFIKLTWLGKGRVSGENQKYFYALLGRLFRIYLTLGFIFAVFLLPAGLLWFEAKNSELLLLGNSWSMPWVVLIVVTSLNIVVLPYIALVEGSGQVREIYALRLVQGVLGSAACWVALAFGGGLWSTAMVPGIGVLIALIWLFTWRPMLVSSAWICSGKEVNWRDEVWPLQWRVGLSWLSGYLLTQIYTPILFQSQGAVVAGQMGLTLTISNMLGLVAQSWIARRVPAMAQAVGCKDWKLFDRLFTNDFFISTGVFIIGALVLCFIRWILEGSPYNGRVLPFWPFVGLLIVAFIGHVNGALAAQLRSFKREPLVWVSLIGALVSVPIALWAAKLYSATGVVLAVLLVQLVLILPISIFLWKTCNRSWRKTV